MNSFTHKIFGYLFLVAILFSCVKKSDLNFDRFDEWEEESITRLINCCPEVKGTVTEFMLLSYFKENLRYRSLNKILIPKGNNYIEVVEEYYESNNSYISIFLEEGELNYSFIYYKDEDKFEEYEGEIEINLNDITKNNSDCCDLNGSHPHIFFYSKLKIENNKIEVLETYPF